MQNLDEVKRRSIRGVISYSFRTVILYLIGVIATGLLSAYLTPDEFGVYFVVTAAVGMLTFLSDVGLAATLVQKKDEPTLTELRTTFTVQQGLAIVIFVLTLALTPVWQRYARLDQSGLLLLYALGFSFVLASLKTIPSILLERKLLFDKIVIPQVVEQLIFYSVAVFMAIKGFGVTSYTAAVLLRSLGGVATMYWIQQWPIGFSFSKVVFKELVRFGAKFQVNDLLARLKDDLFIVVLARFLTKNAMGYIGWAKRWSMFPYQFSVNSVIAITFPTFSRLQEDRERLARAINKSIYFISLVIFPVLAGMIVLALPLTQIVPRFGQWQPALPSLYLFCLSIALAAIATPLTNTLNAIGKINTTLKLMIFWTVLTWGLTPLGVYWFGFTGVAVVGFIISATSLWTIKLVRDILPITFLDQVWRQGIASLVMLMLLWQFRGFFASSFTSFLLAPIAGGVIYLSLLLLLGRGKLIIEVTSLLKGRK